MASPSRLPRTATPTIARTSRRCARTAERYSSLTLREGGVGIAGSAGTGGAGTAEIGADDAGGGRRGGAAAGPSLTEGRASAGRSTRTSGAGCSRHGGIFAPSNRRLGIEYVAPQAVVPSPRGGSCPGIGSGVRRTPSSPAPTTSEGGGRAAAAPVG